MKMWKGNGNTATLVFSLKFLKISHKKIPLTSTCLIISNFALCGIPFLAGFYSKDLILEIVSIDYVTP